MKVKELVHEKWYIRGRVEFKLKCRNRHLILLFSQTGFDYIMQIFVNGSVGLDADCRGIKHQA